MVENGKVLTVTLDPKSGVPIYSFAGLWVGKEAKRAAKHLHKAYRHYQANLRREEDARRTTESTGVDGRKAGRGRKSIK